MHMQEIIGSRPEVRGETNEALIRCSEICYDCAQACTACADACLAEDMVKQLAQCIRLNLDCADVCLATGSLATRRTGSDEQLIARMLDVCQAACRVCAEECERHADMHAHCRACAESCRRCESACREARQTFGAPVQ